MSQEQLHKELQTMIGDEAETTFLITTSSTPIFKAPTSCPFTDRVRKVSAGSRIKVYGKGDGYSRLVNEGLAAEGKEAHTPQARRWGKRIDGTAFIEHTKEGEYLLYLEYFGDGIGEVYYTLDGERATPEQTEEIKSWLRPTYGAPKQSGLEQKVQPFYIQLNNILSISKVQD